MSDWIGPLQEVFRAWDAAYEAVMSTPATTEGQGRALAIAIDEAAARLAAIRPGDLVDEARAAFLALRAELEYSADPASEETPETEARAQAALDALAAVRARVRALRPVRRRRGWDRSGWR